MTYLTLVGRLRAPALAGLVMLTGACEADRLNTISDQESATEAHPTSAPAFASSASSRGVPFGFWRLEYTQLGSDYTGLQANGYTNSIRRNLDIARSRGARVFIRFAGGNSDRYVDSKGHFSVSKFNALLDQYKGIDLESYIADGTLAGHMLLDEPSDADNWNGQEVPFRDLEEAAKHSKSIWPNLPTFARSRPTWLARAPFRWTYLDGGWAQYSARMGQVDEFRKAESQAAAQAGLKVVWGLNLYNGGDGSSKKHGLTSGRHVMSGDEVLKYGKALLAASNSCGFFMWHYDAKYNKSGNVQDALNTLIAEAKSASASCGGGNDGGGGAPGDGAGGDPGPLPGGDPGPLPGGDPGPLPGGNPGPLPGGNPGPLPGGNPGTGAKPPRALFGSSCSSRTCKFTDRSKRANNDLARWEWSFGNGKTSSERNPSYKYDRKGTYKVVLRVTGADGVSNSILHTVRVR